MKPPVGLGDEVTDRITGFTGIVVVTEIHNNGVTKAGVQPQKLHDGKPMESISFDFEDLVIVTKNKVPAVPVTYDGPITFGDEVRCPRNGYQGSVQMIRTSLSGCIEFAVYPHKLDKKGQPPTGMLFHSADVELVKKETQPEKVPVLAGRGTGPAKIARAAR